jgi:WS/DGAT/MGAT family acyltransferase
LDRRLTGLDSAFLAVETHAAHMHMTAVVVLEPSDGERATFEGVRTHLAPRLRQLPIFRRSLQEVPLGLDHPVWVEQDFDLDAHLHRAAVPSPGSDVELQELVGHLAGLPLDRARPLWDMWVVEGLAEQRTAVVTKVHHALIDGVAGAEVLGRLLDAAPDAPSAPASGRTAARRRAPRRPSRAKLLLGAARSLVRRPFEIARQTLGSASIAARRIRATSARTHGEPMLPASFSAPSSPLNGAITARRQTHFGSLPLDELQGLKRTFDVKLNDVVLGLCAGALRRYLGERGEPPKEPLVVAVPVSVAKDAPSRESGNQVSAITVELPVHLEDPVGRLVHIRRATLEAKRAHRAIAGGDVLAGWAEIAPPVLLSGLSEVYSRLDLADRHRPLVNLVVSNVPGPPFSLYCAGHRVRACYPLGPIYEGFALNLTVMSYDGRLHFGWMACPDVVPDLARLGDALSKAAAELSGIAERRRRRTQRRSSRAGRGHRSASRRREQQRTGCTAGA